MQLGIEKSELEVIRQDNMHGGGVSDCFSTMLDMWLKKTEKSASPNEIWITVCKVLKKVDENRLATEIAQKHGM